MASRNLTYLGSPFQEGFGKAAIEEQQRAPMAFLDQMDKLRQERKERDKEEDEKKKASLKSLDDFNLDYAIQHNQYFQNGMKEYREKATDFMAKGGDLGDMSSEEAISLYREKNRLKDEANLSKSLAGNWDAYNKLPADKKGLLSQESIDKFEEFYQIGDLQEQLRLAREGELPTLSV